MLETAVTMTIVRSCTEHTFSYSDEYDGQSQHLQATL